MIRPLNDKILVKMKEYQDKTKSGIILSSSTKESLQIAKVVEVGNKTDTNYIKKGDTIIVNKNAGDEVQYQGKEYSVIKMEDILAVIEF